MGYQDLGSFDTTVFFAQKRCPDYERLMAQLLEQQRRAYKTGAVTKAPPVKPPPEPEVDEVEKLVCIIQRR